MITKFNGNCHDESKIGFCEYWDNGQLKFASKKPISKCRLFNINIIPPESAEICNKIHGMTYEGLDKEITYDNFVEYQFDTSLISGEKTRDIVLEHLNTIESSQVKVKISWIDDTTTSWIKDKCYIEHRYNTSTSIGYMMFNKLIESLESCLLHNKLIEIRIDWSTNNPK